MQLYVPDTSKKCVNFTGISSMPLVFDENGVVKGTIITFLDDMAKRFNFCYKFHLRETDFRNRIENSTTKYIADLNYVYTEKAEVSFAYRSLFYRPDFVGSEFYSVDPMTTMYRYPTVQPDLAGFIKVFDYKVWLLILCSMLIGSICFALFWKFLGSDAVTWATEKIFVLKTGLGEAVVSSTKIFLNQSFDVEAKVMSYRVLCGTLLMFALLITLAYKCNLKATLIVPKVNIPFRNAEEMANNPDYTYYIVKGTIAAKLLKGAPIGSILYRIGQKLVDEDSVTAISQHYERMKTGKKGFIVASLANEAMIHATFQMDGYCHFTLMTNGFMSKIYVFLFKRGKETPWKPIVNFGVVRYREAGLFDHINREYLFNVQKCITNVGKQNLDKLRALAMKDFYGIFILFLAGNVGAMMAFIIEFMIPKILTGTRFN